jgi:hypothetical protein
VLVLLLMTVLLIGGSWLAGAAVPEAETGFIDRIAQERAARGLSSLAYKPDLVEVARRQAQRMADRGEPYHNPNLGSEVHDWQVVAENVGVGYDVAGLHKAFMDSPKHRDNILRAEVTEVGVGVVTTPDGRLWVVELFRLPQSASAAAAPAPTPAPAPVATPKPPAAAPAPRVAPTTTVAPTTAPPPPPTTATPTTAPNVEWASIAATRPLSASQPSEVAFVPEVAAAAREVPPAAWVAAFALSGVVFAQGIAVRRIQVLRGLT